MDELLRDAGEIVWIDGRAWQRTPCQMWQGGGKGSAPAPDPAVGQAAAANAALGKEALEFSKEQYQESLPRLREFENLVNQVVAGQIQIQDENQELAREYADYMRETFRPVEKSLVADAQAYDTPGRRESEAAKAAAQVGLSYDQQKAVSDRTLARGGTTVSPEMRAVLDREAGASKAAVQANAMNTARDNVELQGWARRMDAASLGRGLPGAQATSAQIATQAGNAAVGNAQAPLSAYTTAGNQMMQGYGTAGNLNASAGQLALGSYGAQLQAYNANQANAGGAISGLANLGFAAGSLGWKPFGSSEKIKEGGQPMDEQVALDRVRSIPVKEGWRYKKGKGDGGMHDGPMAEDVQAALGDDVAPGGKMIDPISMQGTHTAAIKALADRLEALEMQMGLSQYSNEADMMEGLPV